MIKEDMKFIDLNTTKLGYRGEEYICEFAQANGSQAYIPAMDKAHTVDSLCYHSGGTHWACEVKTKPRLKYFRKTGYDMNDHAKYMNYPMPVYILFVDAFEKKIYGNWVKKLDEQKEVINDLYVFPLSGMCLHRELTEQEVAYISELNQSNYWTNGPTGLA